MMAIVSVIGIDSEALEPACAVRKCRTVVPNRYAEGLRTEFHSHF